MRTNQSLLRVLFIYRLNLFTTFYIVPCNRASYLSLSNNIDLSICTARSKRGVYRYIYILYLQYRFINMTLFIALSIYRKAAITLKRYVDLLTLHY